MTDQEIQFLTEIQKYKKRAEDGLHSYLQLSAEFRLAKINGLISEESHAEIEKALIPVRNEVLAGQWISAKKELELLGNVVLGNDLYDGLYLQISNYIEQNY